MSRLIIVAYNINTGGGKILLMNLIDSLPKRLNCILFLDYRLFDVFKNSNLKIYFIRNNLLSRLVAEIKIFHLSRNNDISLYFGGLPPIFNNSSKKYLYIQNINNVMLTSLENYPLLLKIRIILERFWLRFFYINIDKIFVQTNFVKDALVRRNFIKRDIILFPFTDIINKNLDTEHESKKPIYNIDSFKFIYPSSFEPHKNHIILLKAWLILSKYNIKPCLVLTLKASDFNTLISKFSFIKSLNIINIGIVSNPYLINFYKKCNCLIFPSKYESFGLPLLEARSLKLPIIAPELDYVREVCCPMETFDPSSSVSLANSVRRFMGINQSPLYIRKPIDFINFLIGDIDSLT